MVYSASKMAAEGGEVGLVDHSIYVLGDYMVGDYMAYWHVLYTASSGKALMLGP